MDSTPLHPRRTARGAVAALSVAALALGGIALAAPANAAENDVIAASGSLDWGFKTSFRSYVTGGMNPLGAAGLVASDGAQRSGAGASAGFLFPAESGHVTDADNLSIDTLGTAGFNFPAHFFEVRLSDLKIVVENGTASLIADTYLKADTSFGDIQPGTYEADDVRIAQAGAVQVNVADGKVTVSGTGVTLTAEGAAANPLYAAGTALDDFSITADLEAGTTEPQPGDPEDIEVTVPQAPVDPETGSFGWEWASTTPASLGTAAQSGSVFRASGALNTIAVTDTRAGGSGQFGWTLSGSVSNFTAGTKSFSSALLGWTPKVTSANAAVVAGPAVTGLDSSRLLASSTAAAGAQVSADLGLEIPTSTPAGDYAATVTITAVG